MRTGALRLIWSNPKKKVATGRIEPTTFRLLSECSTPKLLWLFLWAATDCSTTELHAGIEPATFGSKTNTLPTELMEHLFSSCGGVAHSVERSVRNRQAQGSKPCSSKVFSPQKFCLKKNVSMPGFEPGSCG